MTRFRLLPLVLGLFVATACNKPSEENCRKALANMQLLLGTEHVSSDEAIEGEVRRCKGGSSRESVDCAIKATSIAELTACGFMKLSAGSAAPASDGAAAPTEGSAAPATGSAAPATGSAAAPTEGSAAPATGAAAPTEGSAAPATGAAAAPTEGSAAAPTAGSATPTAGSAAN